MKTTYFRPSIHGWPFGNSFNYTLDLPGFDITLRNLGFCGGMCWSSLQRFYNGIHLPRDIQAPPQGSALYDELLDTQINSLSLGKIWDIYDWQSSPDLGHWNRKHSLGHRTQQEWPKVKRRLDQSRPVTITLIAHSNDYNPAHLEDNHRVVAYAYLTQPVYAGDGSPKGAHTAVTIFIYDPNKVNDDDVRLTFYLGGDDSKIRLRHNWGKEVHGFFLDTPNINFANNDSTIVQINRCEQTKISSATKADYDLEFSWQCRFIPYFSILVDDIEWNHNSVLMQSYEPIDKPDKQCPTRSGNISMNIKLPRTRSKVAVRLLDDENYIASLDIDATPYYLCYPYINSRSDVDYPQVCDKTINNDDLFVKDPRPSQAAIQQVDTSPFRWIMQLRPPTPIVTTSPNNIEKLHIDVIDTYRLGNIIVPILANFVEKNLAPPTITKGFVKIIKSGQPIQTETLNPLASAAQKIFDGFRDNPEDYDNDTRVELTYEAKDKFGVIVQGQATFYGKSIIYQQVTLKVNLFDPAELAKLEVAVRDLIERGLVDIAVELPNIGPSPQPTPIDPFTLKKKLGTHQPIKRIIDQTLKSLLNNSAIWREGWKVQSKILKQEEDDRLIVIGKQKKVGDRLKATNDFRETKQQMHDAAVLNIFADKAIKKIRRNPRIAGMLTSLGGDLDRQGEREERRPRRTPIG